MVIISAGHLEGRHHPLTLTCQIEFWFSDDLTILMFLVKRNNWDLTRQMMPECAATEPITAISYEKVPTSSSMRIHISLSKFLWAVLDDQIFQGRGNFDDTFGIHLAILYSLIAVERGHLLVGLICRWRRRSFCYCDWTSIITMTTHGPRWDVQIIQMYLAELHLICYSFSNKLKHQIIMLIHRYNGFGSSPLKGRPPAV